MKLVIKIGRDGTNDVVINEPRVSRIHATVTAREDGQFEVKDMGSTNGTFINGQRISEHIIEVGDKLEISNFEVNWYEAMNNSDENQIINERPFSKIGKSITVGSDQKNDIVIESEFVTGAHAVLSLLRNGGYYIKDLNSSNGTYVNGVRVGSKNFTITDIVKIATSDLPQDWFRHKKLRTNFIKDYGKGILISAICLILVLASYLVYVNRCNWLGYGCSLTAKIISSKYKNSIVYIDHEYFYTIQVNGVKYYVGRNKEFGVAEANTDKKNLIPYNKITGLGAFIDTEGAILTSSLITNPWINDKEINIMLREIEKSRTIPRFNTTKNLKVCGETANLKWIANELINNDQNYIYATTKYECINTDSTSKIIQPVKRGLPSNVEPINYFFNKNSKDQIHKTSSYFYSGLVNTVENKKIRDTFYASADSLNVKDGVSRISISLPALPEGSVVINERGELVGLVQANRILFLAKFINQIKK